MARSKVSKPGSKPRLKQTAATHPAATNGQTPHASAASEPSPELNGKAASANLAGSGSVPAAITHAAELAEKIKELVRLAQEQGYLTYGDINDALPDSL